MRDLEFVASNYVEYDVPPNRRFLLRYFTTDVQVSFLKYYLLFGDWKHFREHTGHQCSDRLLFRLESRYWQLLERHKTSKTAFTEAALEDLALIESGRLCLTGNIKP